MTVTILQWCGAVLMAAGGVLSLSAAVGIVVLPDVAARLQAATKPQVAGLLLIVVGAAPFLTTWSALGLLTLVAVFQLVTAPVIAQSVALSAYRAGSLTHERLVVDELVRDEPEVAREDREPRE